jgi:adenosylmethionine-8-amino-7-oxononanoate aminotransferase
MAYQFWQLTGRKRKTKFVSLKEGYHGDTLGSVSVGGIDLFHERFRKLLFKGWQVQPPRPSLRGAERRSNPSGDKVKWIASLRSQ